MYATELLADNDLHSILDLGFEIEQIRRLKALSLGDVIHMSTIPSHSLEVRIDARSIDHLLDHIERTKAVYQLQDELMLCNACQEMMRALYGILPHEYAARRKLLGVTTTGRPPAISEADEIFLLKAWKKCSESDLGARYLTLAYQTQAPLSTIWRVIPATTRKVIPATTRKPKEHLIEDLQPA